MIATRSGNTVTASANVAKALAGFTGGYLVILHEMPRIEFHIDTDSCDNAHKIAVALVEKERGKMRLTGATIQKR